MNKNYGGHGPYGPPTPDFHLTRGPITSPAWRPALRLGRQPRSALVCLNFFFQMMWWGGLKKKIKIRPFVVTDLDWHSLAGWGSYFYRGH